MHCGGSNPDKVHIDGCIVRDGKILERYRGVIHRKCIAPMKEERAAKYE